MFLNGGGRGVVCNQWLLFFTFFSCFWAFFFYFLTDFDVIEWEKREWLLGVGVGVAIYNEKASSLNITFLASFEVILGHCRSFQVILAFKTPRKRFVACGSRKNGVLRVFWSFQSSFSVKMCLWWAWCSFFQFCYSILDETLHDGAIDTLLYLLSLLYERMCVRSDVYTRKEGA